MFVRNAIWLRIRDEFTEAEKFELRESVTGESICPPGVTIDLRSNPTLESKLRAAITQVAPGA